MLAHSVGYRVSCNTRKDKLSITRLTCTRDKQRKKANAVKKLENLGTTQDYVYDLETANHHFAAGVGELVVHNTDSVMVRFGPQDRALCFKYADEAGKWVTKKYFVHPNDLEFEKVYDPYLLIAKKNYAGVMFTPKFDDHGVMVVPKKPDYIDYKGLELVRRDSSALTRQAQRDVVEKLLLHRDVDGATRIVKDHVKALHMNQVDMSKLINSKKISRPPEEYVNPQIHIEVAKKRAQRDPSKAVTVGMRVAYVRVPGHKKSKAYQCGEDPEYVVRHNLPIDSQYYIEKHLESPITRVMLPVFKSNSKVTVAREKFKHLGWNDATIDDYIDKQRLADAKKRLHNLFYGTQSLRRVRRAPHHQKGSIAWHFKKTQVTCMKCKIALPQQNLDVHEAPPLCETCALEHSEFVPENLAKQFETKRKMESDHARLWNQCLRCKGNKFQIVQCSNMDCPIWFLRSKRTQDIEDLGKTLTRLSHVDCI